MPYNGGAENRDFVDYDNDGKTDVFFGRAPLALYTLQSDESAAQLIKFGAFRHNSSLTYDLFRDGYSEIGDVNGDGLPDIINAPGSILLSHAGAVPPHLLSSVVTELGATVSAEYTPSSRLSPNYMPQVLHAVTKLSVNDGRGQVAETRYAYSGGKYDPKARKFLGYLTVTESKPLANGETAPATVVTTYRQDLPAHGLPELVQYKDGAGVVRKTVDESWDVLPNRPYAPENKATDTTLAETGGAVKFKMERTFDDWGNLIAEADHGDVDHPGDEKLTRRFFTPNTTKFITSLPRMERIYPTADGSGNPASWTNFVYDDAADASVAPEQGELTENRPLSQRDFLRRDRRNSSPMTSGAIGSRRRTAPTTGRNGVTMPPIISIRSRSGYLIIWQATRCGAGSKR